jgi:hypothetical protein
MPDFSLALGEPFVVPRTARCSGKALVLLSLLVGLGFAALLSSGSGWQRAADSTNLIGLPTSLRSSGLAKKSRPVLPQNLNMLPGAGPWKELALAGLEASNRCGRDVSANAHLKSVLANMNRADKAVVARAQQKMITKAEDLKAGILAPTGFFDPLGLSANLPAGKLLFYREAELKHGRVCMLASLGFLVGENFHPLFGGNIDVPSYIAFQETPLQTFWIAVSIAIGIPEVLYSIPTFAKPVDGEIYKDADTWSMKFDRVPGDIGFDPLGLKPKDEAGFIEMQNKELNNGRLAMIATAGMVAQELVSHEKLSASWR